MERVSEQLIGEPTPSPFVMFFFGTLKMLIAALILLALFQNFFDVLRIEGDSMYPTLKDGEYYLAYKTDNLKNGDIAYFLSPIEADTFYIKRLIASPHEKVQFTNHQLYINDVRVEEPYVYQEQGLREGRTFEQGQDEYLFFGDNRGNSNDSRAFGSVNKQDIYGKVLFKIPFL